VAIRSADGGGTSWNNTNGLSAPYWVNWCGVEVEFVHDYRISFGGRSDLDAARNNSFTMASCLGGIGSDQSQQRERLRGHVRQCDGTRVAAVAGHARQPDGQRRQCAGGFEMAGSKQRQQLQLEIGHHQRRAIHFPHERDRDRYTNAGLLNGTTYFYVVSATNIAGESSNSAPASATPQVSRPEHRADRPGLCFPAAPVRILIAVIHQPGRKLVTILARAQIVGTNYQISLTPATPGSSSGCPSSPGGVRSFLKAECGVRSS